MDSLLESGKPRLTLRALTALGITLNAEIERPDSDNG